MLKGEITEHKVIEHLLNFLDQDPNTYYQFYHLIIKRDHFICN